MNTDNFINNFMTREYAVSKSAAEKAFYWIHKHPTTVKVIEIAGMVLGVAAILSYALTSTGILLAIAGGILGTISAIAYRVLEIAVPPTHLMQNHVFTPGVYGAGKLYYQNDVPILELKYDDPYQAGLAHGFLLAPNFEILWKRFDYIKQLSSPTKNGATFFPKVDEVPQVLKALRDKIPPDYLKEMQGFVDGYNKWETKGKKISVDELLIIHLMPDSRHFIPQSVETKNKSPLMTQLPSPACTVVIDKDEKEGMMFERNMDWPSFGVFGTHSLVINRKQTNGKLSSVEVGFPGFVGTLTGMNRLGLSLAMNVCVGETQEVKGMPAVFYNRYCLENCNNVAELETKVKELSPLGSYHLSAADTKDAKSFHFYQDHNQKHLVRNWVEGNPLIVTNCRYSCKGKQYHHMHSSQERAGMINKFFKEAKETVKNLEISKIIRSSLALPYVNNYLATHKVEMCPLSKKMKVAFNNAYAGEITFNDLEASQLLII